MTAAVLKFDPKRTTETVDYGHNFKNNVPSGDTITDQDASISVKSGTDANPDTMITASASASGTIVRQRVTGGVGGVVYCLVFQATLSGGQILEQAVEFTVSDDC